MTTAARRKRLERLEAPAKARELRKVLIVPAIDAEMDSWSARAEASQAALARDTREGVDGPVVKAKAAPDVPWWQRGEQGPN